MKVRAFAPAVVALLFGLAGLLVVLIEKEGGISTRFGFVALTFVLVLYLGTQVMLVRRVHSERWLLNPAVLCSFMTFFMGFGLGNAVYFLPEATLDSVGMTPDISPAMLKLLSLVLLGAIGMWMGYWSRLAAVLSNAKQQKKFSSLLRQSEQLNPWAVPALIAISSISRIVSIKLGIYGYSSTYERLIEMGGVTQYLALLSSLGKLALVAASLEYFSHKSSIRAKAMFILALGIEVFFGLLSGFKTPVVMPFVIVGICQYIKIGSVPRKWMLFVIFSIALAYQIIEPFREAKNSDISFKGTSVTEIAGVMINAEGKKKNSQDDEPNTALSFIARSSMTYIGSLGIEFSDELPELPDGSPEFLKNILFAPIYALVPRGIWSGKPLGNLGAWYEQVVVGKPYSLSSTAMSPFTYLYFSGGAIAIFFGFFFVGVIQRLLLFLLQPYLYLGGTIVYLGILTLVVTVDNSFDSFIVDLMRQLPLLLLTQWIIVKRENKRQSSSSRLKALNRPIVNPRAGDSPTGSDACAD